MNRNIKLIIAYDGTDFHGWQRQKNRQNTIQAVIEKALEKMHGHPVNLTGSGRTDTGVHAAGQTANFFTDIDSIPAERFSFALNSLLPPDIRILESSETDESFHSRFSAKTRLYRYQFICHSSITSVKPQDNRFNLQLHRFPNIELLNAYGRIILGETDCSIFTGAGDITNITGKSKNRFIYKAHFFTEHNKLIFEISANAFLRNMVRSVTGTFLFYEEANLQPEKLKEIISSGRRDLAGPTLPPNGLFLWKVEY
ncbi:MAG: tRNA pseudouridine(38-40) synthase TruA [Treponema sp.]|nr:tRNA pseudouridine(38-40) synthase TruA [Treponema sp.]